MKAKRAKRERKLPVGQLTILAICRFAEPLASTSLAPYVPEMVRSFGVAEKDVGGWAGLCSAMFSFTQALTGVPWGRFSDIYGRKISILLGLTSTMLTSLLWGFSKNLPMAITARILAGAGNGNVGILRTFVAELVPFKELQPRAFSLMPLVWNIGSIFGPSIGGILANPLNVKPGEVIHNPSLFQRFPYLLPNLVSAIFFAIGITVGFLFLEETLETQRDKRDLGLRLGKKLKAFWRSNMAKISSWLKSDVPKPAEREPLLKSYIPVEEDGRVDTPSEPRAAPPSFREVLNKQSILNLVVYTLLAMHSMAYDSLLPVYLGYKRIYSHSPDVTPHSGFLKWFGGFGLDHSRIGILITCYGVFGMVVQFFVFPPVARRFGILTCLKVCVVAFPIAYILMPFTALIHRQSHQVAVCFALMLFKCACGIFAFPASTILITNSASSLRTLGTLNGFATSFSAVGRALGPASAGMIFNIGAKKGYVLFPWWHIAAIGILGAIPAFWLVEGEGFGGEDEVSDVEDDDDDDNGDLDEPQAGKRDEVTGQLITDSANAIQATDAIENEETGYGGVGALLSRTTTNDSTVLIEDGIEQSDVRPGPSRRNSRRIVRKMSIPVGLHKPISRKYSSNLGQSLSSTGSYL